MDSTVEELRERVCSSIIRFYTDPAQRGTNSIYDLRSQVTKVWDAYENRIISTGNASENTTHDKNVALLELLDKIARIHRGFSEFDLYVAGAELGGTGACLQDIKLLLDDMQQTMSVPVIPEKVIHILQDEYLKRHANLTVRLNELFRAMVAIQSDLQSEKTFVFTNHILSTPSASYHDGPVSVEDLTSALTAIGLLEPLLCQLFTSLLDSFIQPICQTTQYTLKLQTMNIATKLSLIRLKSDESNETVSGINFILENVKLFANMIGDQVLVGIDDVPISLHSLVQERLVRLLSPIIERVLCTVELHDKAWDELYNACTDFENHLISKNLFKKDFHGLSDELSRLNLAQCRRDRTTWLKTLQDIFTSDDQNTVAVPSDDEPGLALPGSGKESKTKGGKGAGGKHGLETGQFDRFRLAPCRVSAQVHLLIQMVYNVLNGMSQESCMENLEKWYSIRDAFDMYRAVYISHQEEVFECFDDTSSSASVSSTLGSRVMLLHNDCVYISHHLYTLGHTHRQKLPAGPTRETATVLDLVPFFKGLGESYFLNFMELQRRELLQHVAPCQGHWTELNIPALSKKMESHIQTIVGILGHLGREWKPISSSEFYFKTMGLLVDVALSGLLSQCIQEIQSLQTKSSSSHFDCWTSLRYLFSLLQRIERLFVIESGYGDKKRVTRGPIQRYVSTWSIFQQCFLAIEAFDMKPFLSMDPLSLSESRR